MESPDTVVSDYYGPQVCAHTRHIIGTHQAQRFDRIFEKMSDVPFVCHMCAHTWGASQMLKSEKYGQFTFE